MNKSAPSRSPEKTLKNVLVKISAVLFCPNGARAHVGPLPHMLGEKIACPWNGSPRRSLPTRLGVLSAQTGGASPSPTTFTLLATQRDSAEQRTVEFIRKRMPSVPTRFDILSAQGNSSEAASLKSLGPYGQNAHKPGDLQGDLESPCTRFLRFTSLTRVKEVKNKPIKVRKLCSHNLNLCNLRSPHPPLRGPPSPLEKVYVTLFAQSKIFPLFSLSPLDKSVYL